MFSHAFKTYHSCPLVEKEGGEEGRAEKTDRVKNKEKAITVSHLLNASSQSYLFHQAFPSSLIARALCLSESPLGLRVHSSPPMHPCI